MYELIYGSLTAEELTLSDSELSARLGGARSFSEDRIYGAFRELFSTGEPRYIATRLDLLSVEEDRVVLPPFTVYSRDFSRYARTASQIYVVMVTLGMGADRLIMRKRAGSLSEGFLYDGVASAMIEAACDAAEAKILPNAEKSNRFSPGYGDLPLTLQSDIIRLLGADKRLGITLSAGLLMTPHKTVSAFIGVKK